MNKPTNIQKKKKIEIACLERCRSIFLVLCTALLLIVNCQLSLAQSFPVQIIPQVVPPPPIYFSDYANAGTVNSPLRVQIVLNDLNITNREVRLRTSFEGNGITFQSNDIVSGAGPLFLEGGVPLVLTNVELAPYFQFQNITGISPDVYGQAIPEGLYQFCFEVFDVLTGNRLSQRSCVSTVVFQNEPPFLISPYNKSNIEERNPQNIVFQWTPRHINVSNVAYELSIVEIWDNVVDPQAVFLSSPPVFQVTTTATTYVYGPADPLFLSNKSYAWRVQAKAIQGVEEIGLFENQGFSEIFSFSYAKTCDIPQSVSHEVKGSHQANINWEDFTTEVPEFTVRYREKGDASNEWFLSKTTANWVTIWDLKPGTTYEYQVNKKCVVTESEWSLEKEFTTALEIEESDLYECGISPNINVTNQDPLPNISSGEKFKAGDFPVTVREVNGSNGRFTGKGHVSLPYLENIKIAVEFTNILINEEKELAEGTVITVYDPEWKNILDTGDVADVLDDLGDVFTGGDNVDIPLDYEITKDDIKIEDGEIVVTKPDGTTETFDYDEGDTYQITDASGNTFAIDENGNITQEAEGAEGGAATSQNTDGIVSGGNGNVGNPSVGNITANGVLVVFKKGNAKYDFDEADNDFEKTRYPKAKLPNGEDYYPVHKAVIDGKTDEFLAEVTITNPDVVLDSLIFKTVKGAKITTRKIDDKNIAITIKGSNSYRSEEAIITYKDKDGKYKIAASFFIHHIKEQELVNVVMVSVNGAAHIPGLESELNKIYEKAGAKFKIVKEDALQLSVSDWDTKTTNGLLDYDGSGLLSDYPQELKNIHQKYKRDHTNYDPKAYHLFLLPDDIKLTKPLSGFMPKTRQWGYVFNAHKNGEAIENKSSQDLVAAHELGHGVFTLAHPFQNDDSAGSGTNWLMDYGGGNQIPYAHWAAMGDESLQLYLFQDEEDSEIADKYWFSPSWEMFTVKGTNTVNSGEISPNHVKGTIPGFNLNNKTYRAEYDNTGKFSGYFSKTAGKYELVPKENPQKEDKVYLFQDNGDCGKHKYYESNFEYVNNNKEALDFNDAKNVKNGKVIPCSIDLDKLCQKGREYFNDYESLLNDETEKYYLFQTAKLICEAGSDELVEAQKKQYEAWEGTAKSISQNVQKPFSWESYYNTLFQLKKWVEADVDKLLDISKREILFETAFALEEDVLSLLYVDFKLKALQVMFDGDLQKIFYPNHHDVIAKVVRSVKDNEAVDFIGGMESTKYYVKNKPLIYHFKERLDDFFTDDAYSSFFEEIIRLSKVRADNGNIQIKTAVVWDVVQKDYVLVSYVQNRNDFSFSYNNDTNKVTITKCVSCCAATRGCTEKRKTETLLDSASPFDMVGVTILNDVSPLGASCEDGNRSGEAIACGEMTPVPAIFLEYLGQKENNQKWENFGWNTFNVIITIATLGEGGAVIATIRAAAPSARLAIAIKNGYTLLDFTYTVTDLGLQAADVDRPEAWTYIGYLFQVKSAYDMLNGGLKGLARLKNASRQTRRKIVEELQVKKDGQPLTDQEIDEFIADIEAKINENPELEDDYKKAIDEVINANTFTRGDFDDLNAVTPQRTSQTNLGKKVFKDEAIVITPTTGTLKTKVDNILTSGDSGGQLTEEISDILYQTDGFIKKEVKLGSNQGIDGLFVKGDIDNPTAIHIDEAKYSANFNSNGIKLNSGNTATDLPVQMSDDWIENVANRMEKLGNDTNDENLIQLSRMLLENPDKIVKSVTTVNPKTGEINILKLANYTWER